MYPTSRSERALYAAHIHHLRLMDEGLIDEAVSWFGDAVVMTSMGSCGGAEAVARWLAPVKGFRTKHMMSTFDIRLSSDGREAWTCAYILLLKEDAGRIVPVQALPCRDHFVLDNGAWRLVDRVEVSGGRLP